MAHSACRSADGASPWRATEQVALLSAAEMRAWEQIASDRFGVSPRLLLENAGRAAAEVVQRHFPNGPVVALVGRGNNGGDARVVLRTLAAWGRIVVEIGAEPAGTDLLHGWPVRQIPAEHSVAVQSALASAGVIVDGLLGTGTRGAPRPAHAELIRAANDSGRPIVALDLPSGIDPDTGAVPGVAIRAALTASFGGAKRGLLRFPGRTLAGRILVVEIGLAPTPPDGSARLVTPAWAAARMPSVPPDAHKGRMGTVVVIGGRAGSTGAVVMAALGALRAGAGLAVVVSDASSRIAVQTALPEALFSATGEQRPGPEPAAWVIGPGLGTDAAARAAVLDAVAGSEAPMVLDADAITLLSREPGLLPREAGPRVLLTPHPKEMARLLGGSVTEVLADPFAAAEQGAERFGCAVLLKGHPSLVAAAGHPTLASVFGHSGVATGGMGDTLAGVAGALLAQGAPPREAAALALYLAGRAAELAGGGRGLLPRDVDRAIPRVWDELSESRPEPGGAVLLDLPPAR